MTDKLPTIRCRLRGDIDLHKTGGAADRERFDLGTLLLTSRCFDAHRSFLAFLLDTENAFTALAIGHLLGHEHHEIAVFLA